MLRARILSSKITDPSVAKALREHAVERSQLLEALIAGLKQDERIRAAWYWGSFLRGDQDDLSDLDLWLVTSEACLGEMGAIVSSGCHAAGSVVTSGEAPHNAPPGGGYFSALIAGTHGLHHLDVYWQPASLAVGPNGKPIAYPDFLWKSDLLSEVPATAMLFDRTDEPPSALSQKSPVANPLPAKTDAYSPRISFIWLMLSIAAKYLARDSQSDLSLLSYARPSFEEATSMLALGSEIGEIAWTAPESPSARIEVLRNVAQKTRLIEAAARDRGIDVSEEAIPCLMRYFDLVEAIYCAKPR
jgi:hypothetical protein